MNGPFLEQKKLIRSARPVIFDCGANIGQTTTRYLKIFPNAIVHAFEPNPAVFGKLKRAHGTKPRVVLNQAAVGSASKDGKLFVGNHPGTSSLLPKNEDFSPGWRFTSEVPVRVVTLDDYCKGKRIQHIDVLKMDIQGYELEALRGATDLLGRHAIDLIFLEVLYVELYEGAPLVHHLHDFLVSQDYLLLKKYAAASTFGDRLYRKCG